MTYAPLMVSDPSGGGCLINVIFGFPPFHEDCADDRERGGNSDSAAYERDPAEREARALRRRSFFRNARFRFLTFDKYHFAAAVKRRDQIAAVASEIGGAAVVFEPARQAASFGTSDSDDRVDLQVVRDGYDPALYYAFARTYS